MHVLKDATNNFNENMVLGKGGFAVVFKGILNGEPVAVKKFNSATMGTEQVKEFLFETDVIGKLSHLNLVKLLGYCVNSTDRFLVYEYMSAGTLHEHLQSSGHTPLTWAQRRKISLDVARGIEYLHGLTQQKFIHRDLNPSNILLGQDLGAKVSDFGLVRTIEDKSSTSKPAGTFGCLAPEYASMYNPHCSRYAILICQSVLFFFRKRIPCK
jgi:serine/threonine protein kinase